MAERKEQPLKSARGSTLSTLAACTFLMLDVTSASAQAEVLPPAAFAPYVEMIRELDLRRRVNVMYPNPQSIFDGVQVGFVNTSTGNLTFRRRDIVTRAQGPVIFARVYDSRSGANADFGTGWRLSLAEELVVSDDTVTYIDDAGARHTFERTGAHFAQSPSTPRHNATRLYFGYLDGTTIATLVDGATTRTFESVDPVRPRYVVKSVKTDGRELVFDYDEGRLRTVSHNGATLFHIRRNAEGRVSEVHDGHGRSTSYMYDSVGRLMTVRDIAGNDWVYRYNARGELDGADGPNGQTYLTVVYNTDRMVAESFSGRLYSYAYADGHTTVTEGTGELHTLSRSALMGSRRHCRHRRACRGACH